mgnify:CR=1 FL=1
MICRKESFAGDGFRYHGSDTRTACPYMGSARDVISVMLKYFAGEGDWRGFQRRHYNP